MHWTVVLATICFFALCMYMVGDELWKGIIGKEPMPWVSFWVTLLGTGFLLLASLAVE